MNDHAVVIGNDCQLQFQVCVHPGWCASMGCPLTVDSAMVNVQWHSCGGEGELNMDATTWCREARRACGLTLAGIALVVAAGCGGGSDGTSTAERTAGETTNAATATPTASSQTCADVAALRESIANLDDLDLPNAGKAGLQTALQDVRTNLDALKASAGDQWTAQVGELDAAIGAFQETVAGVQGDNLLSSIPTIVSNLQRLDDSWTSLQDRIDAACPSS
jgi:hypothetical protein